MSVYFTNQPEPKIQIIEKLQNGIIWLKLPQTMFPFDEDVFLCHTYMPPADSRILRQNDIDMFDELEKKLGKIQ